MSAASHNVSYVCKACADRGQLQARVQRDTPAGRVCTDEMVGCLFCVEDARRYRFLRSLNDPGPDDPRVHTLDQQHDPVQVRLCFGDDLDKAVDAAMARP